MISEILDFTKWFCTAAVPLQKCPWTNHFCDRVNATGSFPFEGKRAWMRITIRTVDCKNRAEGLFISVFYAFAVTFFLRKKPPAIQISSATPATMVEPTRPETVVPAALSLFAKA